jgi:hypothetical protein
MSEISRPPSGHESQWRRAVRERYLKRRFPDADQRTAQNHLHNDLKNSAVRVESFRAENEAVRAQVMMELRHLSELNTAGNAAPALSALLGAVTVAVTLFGTLVFAVFNGWFGAVVKMTDEETGFIEGLTQQQFNDTVSAVTILLLLLALAVLGASCWAVFHARGKDHRRAVSVVWLKEYAGAVAIPTEVELVPESARGPSGFWAVVSAVSRQSSGRRGYGGRTNQPS